MGSPGSPEPSSLKRWKVAGVSNRLEEKRPASTSVIAPEASETKLNPKRNSSADELKM